MTRKYTSGTASKGTNGALLRHIAPSAAKILLSMPQLLAQPVGIYARHGERNGSYPWDVVS